MVKIKVKTIWQGKVGIRDKYIFQAQEKKENLFVEHETEVMEIPYDKVPELIVGKSEFKVGDRFGQGGHYLIYFNWLPSSNQLTLV